MPANGDTYTADGITYVFDAATGRYKRANSNDLASHNHADQYSPLGHTHSTTGEPTNAATISAAGGILETDTDPNTWAFVDADGLMTNNSHLYLPTQKAVRDYVAAAIAFFKTTVIGHARAITGSEARPTGFKLIVWDANAGITPTNAVTTGTNPDIIIERDPA